MDDSHHLPILIRPMADKVIAANIACVRKYSTNIPDMRNTCIDLQLDKFLNGQGEQLLRNIRNSIREEIQGIYDDYRNGSRKGDITKDVEFLKARDDYFRFSHQVRDTQEARDRVIDVCLVSINCLRQTLLARRLEELPQEIRDMIYEFVFEDMPKHVRVSDILDRRLLLYKNFFGDYIPAYGPRRIALSDRNSPFVREPFILSPRYYGLNIATDASKFFYRKATFSIETVAELESTFLSRDIFGTYCVPRDQVTSLKISMIKYESRWSDRKLAAHIREGADTLRRLLGELKNGTFLDISLINLKRLELELLECKGTAWKNEVDLVEAFKFQEQQVQRLKAAGVEHGYDTVASHWGLIQMLSIVPGQPFWLRIPLFGASSSSSSPTWPGTSRQ